MLQLPDPFDPESLSAYVFVPLPIFIFEVPPLVIFFSVLQLIFVVGVSELPVIVVI